MDAFLEKEGSEMPFLEGKGMSPASRKKGSGTLIPWGPQGGKAAEGLRG